MSTINCIIVEDEPLAAEVIEDYISEVPFLTLKGICPDAIYALDILNNEHIDLMFLDLHLPKLDGLSFLKTLKSSPQIIITTAYEEFALQSYDYGVVDYLLKPISFERFLASLEKLKKPSKVENIDTQNTDRPFRFFNVGRKMVKVFFDEILYVEGQKDYVQIYTLDNKIFVRGNISQFEKLFEPYGVFRIHRSYLVALKHIHAYSTSEVEVNKKTIPIGRSYKALFGQLIEDYVKDSNLDH